MGPKKSKVIFDANIYLSFFLTRGETIAAIFDLWQEGVFDVYVSPEIIAEVRKASSYPKLKKYFGRRETRKLSLLFETVVKKVYPLEKISFPRDQSDAMYLEVVKACEADYLVTGDKDLLHLKKINRTLIVSPKEFLSLIKYK